MKREEAKKELHYSLQFGTLKPNLFIDKIYDSFENKKCENCKQWVGNAPFKGFCNVTGSSCCLGGCNDYFEPKE